MLRRFLVLVVLSFWQGGFVFYAAVVVPVGMSVLRPPALQSFITLRVTHYLNIVGAVALGVLALEILFAHDAEKTRVRVRFGLWLLMTFALVGLFILHPRIARWMDADAQTIIDRESLYPLHRLYLLLSAAQWLCAMVFTVLTLSVWRDVERKMGEMGA
jgi:hypothetical protein